MSDLMSTHYDDKYFDWQASMGATLDRICTAVHK